LYARGSDRYLVGDRIFLRQVEIYLPESEDRSHILTSAILEGILVAQESRCRFFVYDILRIEGEDLRLRAYERRLSALHTRVLRFRRDQQTRGLFADFFKTDEIEMDGLPFLRLKYVDSIVDNPQKYIPGCRARGLFFCHKGTPTERWMMWWRGPCKIGLPLTVRLTAGVVEGVATDGADVIPVATFGQATDAWKAVEGRCVDVWQSEDGKWELMGISEAETPVSASAFASAAGGAGRRMYSEEDLKKDILAITRLPQYVEEDLSKMHANRA
jgi:hypothetical protein